MDPVTNPRIQSLLLVLGDQLDHESPVLQALDRGRDTVLMAEVASENENVPVHRQRTVLFLSAMRHFADELREAGFRVRYAKLGDRGNMQSLGGELKRAMGKLRPDRVVVTQPGDHRVERELREVCPEIEIEPDTSFTCSLEEFDAWADGRRELTMEFFYRERRRALNVLMDGKRPVGGEWNYDKQNREAFKTQPKIRKPYRARSDDITREVMRLVDKRWPKAPGRMEAFDWPVTRAEALRALRDFIKHRLSGFGTYEDAMWAGEPTLYHSRLASSLNLKLLKPAECVEAAIRAYEQGEAALNDVEGFVRQIIGWREFIRGVYYREGTDYRERNRLDHEGQLPDLFWTGETEMRCLRHCVGEVLDGAWGHHIPRLMVIGNFALIAGVAPQAINDWFLGMYTDAVDWVTTPNVVGMSQHADGGIVGTKPYAASGKYIDRMSNYCASCPYDVKKRTGEDACPFNVFYWDFLIRHHRRFKTNRRMAMVLKNVERLDSKEKRAIRDRAQALRGELGV